MSRTRIKPSDGHGLSPVSQAQSILAEKIMNKVLLSLETLAESGKAYGGLFPSIADRNSGKIMMELPPCIPGQRIGDRAFKGSNLVHDESTLRTMYALGTALNRPEFTEAADSYLRHFATHCTDTATGLFPWGEHSFWQIVDDRPGDGSHNVNPTHRGSPTHDHLRQAPVWLWEKLYEFNPKCVERFAEGLEYHWVEGDEDEYNRHATLQLHSHWPKHASWSGDFPRHGGFFILEWAFASAKTGRRDFLPQIEKMLSYWQKRKSKDGILPLRTWASEAPPPYAAGQTLSFAASLLESSELLKHDFPVLVSEMRAQACAFTDGFFSAPHDIQNGIFALQVDRDTGAIKECMPIWGSRYGLWPAAYVALTCLCTYRLTEDERLLNWAAAAGKQYIKHTFPKDTAVPAMDAGLGLGLLVDLYDITGDTLWRDGALTLAGTLTNLYLDAPLPRGASGFDWYDSQMGPGFLLHGLARTALAAKSREGDLDADYTAR